MDICKSCVFHHNCEFTESEKSLFMAQALNQLFVDDTNQVVDCNYFIRKGDIFNAD